MQIIHVERHFGTFRDITRNSSQPRDGLVPESKNTLNFYLLLVACNMNGSYESDKIASLISRSECMCLASIHGKDTRHGAGDFNHDWTCLAYKLYSQDSPSLHQCQVL